MAQKTQQHRDLLLKYICASVPHELKVEINGYYVDVLKGISGNTVITDRAINYPLRLVKPYLRPLSSMTEEEYQELLSLTGFDTTQITEGIVWLTSGLNIYVKDDITVLIDWLIAKHFDYLGLIPMDLALPAPEGMYQSVNLINKQLINLKK